mmetsp:Transcript_12964/g.36265  ORF Transcript_12964/g.36265 Transcript_12964/m.36265 type:complete len:321 (+) Transcript_12964:897-1859(+)
MHSSEWPLAAPCRPTVRDKGAAVASIQALSGRGKSCANKAFMQSSSAKRTSSRVLNTSVTTVPRVAPAHGKNWCGSLRSKATKRAAISRTRPRATTPERNSGHPGTCTVKAIGTSPSSSKVQILAPLQSPSATTYAGPWLTLSTSILMPSLAAIMFITTDANLKSGISCAANLVSMRVTLGKLYMARETESCLSVSIFGLTRPMIMTLLNELPGAEAAEAPCTTQSGQGTSRSARPTASASMRPPPPARSPGSRNSASAARAASRAARSQPRSASAAARCPGWRTARSPPCTSSSTVAKTLRRHSSRTSAAPPAWRCRAR